MSERKVRRKKSAKKSTKKVEPAAGLYAHAPAFERAVRDWADSEAIYFGQLRTAVLEFQAPLRDAGLLSGKAASEIFVNVDQLLAFAGEQLADLTAWLDADAVTRPSAVPLAAKLLGAQPVLKEYAVNHSAGQLRLEAACEASGALRKAIAKREAAHDVELSALLEAPILRLANYPVLLSRLVRHAPTPTYAAEMNALAEPIEIWVEEQVAQTRLDAAAFKQLAQVAERIDGFEVCVPGRTFVHEGDASMRAGTDAGSVAAKSVRLFLFNDVLVVAAPKTFNKRRFDFKQHVLLDAMTDVRSLVSDTTANQNWLRVQKLDNERMQFDFGVKSNTERVQWLGYMQEIVKSNGGMQDDTLDTLDELSSPNSGSLRGSQTLPRPNSNSGSLRKWAQRRTNTNSLRDYKVAYQSGGVEEGSVEESPRRPSETASPRSKKPRRPSRILTNENEEWTKKRSVRFADSIEPADEVVRLQAALATVKRELLDACSKSARLIVDMDDLQAAHQVELNALNARLSSLEAERDAERAARRATEDMIIDADPDDAAVQLAVISTELAAMHRLVDQLLADDSPRRTQEQGGRSSDDDDDDEESESGCSEGAHDGHGSDDAPGTASGDEEEADESSADDVIRRTSTVVTTTLPHDGAPPPLPE